MPESHRIRNSWQLFRGSIRVLVRDPRLLLFPVVTFACTAVIALFFIAPAVLLPTGHPLNTMAHWSAIANHWGTLVQTHPNARQWHPSAAAGAYLAAIYLVSMVCATFFNVAFYQQILRALAGERVSLREGLRFACQRIRPILVWSLFAGVIGLLIKALEQRSGWVGRWVMRVVGLVWSVASVFAIPVLVREPDTNPLHLLRNSTATLKKTWGEALIGYVGITFGSWLLIIGSLLFLLPLGAVAIWMQRPVMLIFIGVAWVVGMLAISAVLNVANDIFRCALYVYASEGVIPEPYTAELMDAAWKVKKG